MIRAVIAMLPEGRARDLAFTAGGAAALVAGQRVAALSMLGRGLLGAEHRWRGDHPEFDGTWAHRWELAIEAYDANHTTRANRLLHAAALPLLVGGAAGLLVLPGPGALRLGAASWLALGWGMTLVGHLAFDQEVDLSSGDVLASIAGPLRDLRNLGVIVRGEPDVRARPRRRPEPITIYGGEPAQA